MSTISSSIKPAVININFNFGGAVEKISTQHAQVAQQLLGSLGFGSEFNAPNEIASFAGATAASPYSALQAAPAGYNQNELGGALATIGGNQGLAGFAYHGGFGNSYVSPGQLEFTDRMATSALRDVVGQAGVQLKELSGLLAPAKPGEVDKFATGQTCRTGKHNPSNLSNADHITLAIYDILKANQDKGINAAGRPGGMSHEDLAKALEEKYGIKAKVTTVKSKEGDSLKALEFEGGQVFADGAGDGQADLGDYDFNNAVKDIQARTGMTRESFAANAGEFKVEQGQKVEMRAKLDGFLKEAGALWDKLGKDFEERWGRPLDLYRTQVPPWLEKPVDASNPEVARSRDALGKETLNRRLFPMQDVMKLFSMGWMFSTDKEEARRPDDRPHREPRVNRGDLR